MANNQHNNTRKEHLDHVALDIELILISVIQGVALTFLASNAIDFINKGEVGTWLYILSGFLLILLFWSQAIIHAVSFIKWPLDLVHTFFYFLVSFAQIITFSHLNNSLAWFISFTFFLICAGILYVYDYFYIQRSSEMFTTPQQKRLYTIILKRQLFEMRVFLPLGFLYHLMAIGLLWCYPIQFIQNGWNQLLILGQVGISLVVLIQGLQSFKERSQLLLSES